MNQSERMAEKLVARAKRGKHERACCSGMPEREYPGDLAKTTTLRYDNVLREMIVQYVHHIFHNMRGARTSRRVPAF